jgi:hypothetical protein
MSGAFTEECLKGLCERWQKILRLRDWRIYTEICRARDMPENVQGHNKIDLLKKKSVIAIIDEVDVHPGSAWPHDPEKTLVHELIHLHFESGETLSGARFIAVEQGVEILSEVLVDMMRREEARICMSSKLISGTSKRPLTRFEKCLKGSWIPCGVRCIHQCATSEIAPWTSIDT